MEKFFYFFNSLMLIAIFIAVAVINTKIDNIKKH